MCSQLAYANVSWAARLTNALFTHSQDGWANGSPCSSSTIGKTTAPWEWVLFICIGHMVEIRFPLWWMGPVSLLFKEIHWSPRRHVPCSTHPRFSTPPSQFHVRLIALEWEVTLCWITACPKLGLCRSVASEWQRRIEMSLTDRSPLGLSACLILCESLVHLGVKSLFGFCTTTMLQRLWILCHLWLCSIKKQTFLISFGVNSIFVQPLNISCPFDRKGRRVSEHINQTHLWGGGGEEH